MPAQLRAALLAALHAAAPAALALIAAPGPNWTLVIATFIVTYGGSLLLSLFHLQLTPQQEQSIVAIVAPILAQIGPALVALLERQPAPVPPAPTPVEVKIVQPAPTVPMPTTVDSSGPGLVAPTPVPAPEPPTPPAAPVAPPTP